MRGSLVRVNKSAKHRERNVCRFEAAAWGRGALRDSGPSGCEGDYVDWESVANKEDVDSAVSTWNKLFTNIADRHAPVRKARIRGVCCQWMNSQLSQAMSQRNYLHRRAIKSNSPYLWSRYKKLKNYVNKEMQKCKVEYYSNLISENKSNPSALWKTLNDITSHKQSSPISCIETDGVAHCDNPSIAKILNIHFSTIGTKLAMKLKSFITLPSPQVRSTDLPKFAFKPITEEFVHGQLKQLRTNKAIGLDNINNNNFFKPNNKLMDGLPRK